MVISALAPPLATNKDNIVNTKDLYLNNIDDNKIIIYNNKKSYQFSINALPISFITSLFIVHSIS